MHGTAALGAIKGDEPSLTAVVTRIQKKVALVNNAESGINPLLVENAILQND